jgi:hypothetical protein
LRPRNSILEITCPVCKKTLNKLKSVSFQHGHSDNNVDTCKQPL